MKSLAKLFATVEITVLTAVSAFAQTAPAPSTETLPNCDATTSLAAVAPAATLATVQSPQFVVGDCWKYRAQDIGNGAAPTWHINIVRSVADNEVLIEGRSQNQARFWWVYEPQSAKWLTRFSYDEGAPDRRGRKTADLSANDPSIRFPLTIGANWTVNEKFEGRRVIENDMKAVVSAVERITTPAGEFDTFRITYEGRWNNRTEGGSGRRLETYWYSPLAKRYVKREGKTWVNKGGPMVWDQWVEELIEIGKGK